MHLDFLFVFSNLFGLFILMAVGAAAVRLRLVPDGSMPAFSALLMNITLPCTVFSAIATKAYDPGFFHDALIIILIGFIVFPSMLFLTQRIARLIGVREGSRGMWAFCATFTNNGYMGYPIILALLGSDALALAGMLNIAFCLCVFTVGALSICQDVQGGGMKLDLKKILFTKVNFSILLGLIVYFSRLPLPSFVQSPVTFLSDCTTPLAMMISGMALGNINSLETLKDRDVYTASLFTLTANPLICLFVLRLVPFSNPLILPTFILTMAMPTAAIGSVLAETYHGNLALAAKANLVSNILSLITIPLICMLL